jgi:hypothetical protein
VVGKNGKRLSALACRATGEIDDYAGCDIVVENEEGWMDGVLTKRANQECELAGQARLEVPMGADDGELKGRRGDEGVSEP